MTIDIQMLHTKQPLTFSVLGRPQTAGSKRAFPYRKKDGSGLGVRVTDDNPRTKDWQQSVATAAWEARAIDGPMTLLTGPLVVEMLFRFVRPASHYRAGKHAGELRPSAPDRPAKRPDLLKLARAVEDACTGVVWVDDAQIVVETLEKVYGTPAGVDVAVRSYVAR